MYTTPDEWYDAAVAKKKEGQLNDAVSMLNELLAKHPGYALAYAALGAYYTQKELFDLAVDNCQKYCELEPQDPFGYTILSSLCIKLGRRQEAEEALMKSRNLRMG